MAYHPAIYANSTVKRAMKITGKRFIRITFPSFPLRFTVAQAAIIPLIRIMLPRPPPIFCNATVRAGFISSMAAVSNCSGAKRILETVHEPAKNVPKIPIKGDMTMKYLPVIAAQVWVTQSSIPGIEAPLSDELIMICTIAVLAAMARAEMAIWLKVFLTAVRV